MEESVMLVRPNPLPSLREVLPLEGGETFQRYCTIRREASDGEVNKNSEKLQKLKAILVAKRRVSLLNMQRFLALAGGVPRAARGGGCVRTRSF